MSQRFNLVRIGSIWFTNDGTETGTRCKVLVNGVDVAALDYAGTTIVASTGKAYTQLVDFAEKQGTVFSFQFADILITRHEAILDMMNDLLGNETNAVLEISGSFKNISTNVKPMLPGAVTSNGEFRGDYIKQVTYTFIVDI